MSARHKRKSKRAAALQIPQDETKKVAAVQLCASCGRHPRGAGGKLSRCLNCVRIDAQRDREAREAVQARAAKAAAEKLAIGTKSCRTCHHTKPIEAFSKHHLSKDFHRYDCKTCVKAGRAKAQLATERKTEEQRARNAEARHRPHLKAVNRRSVRSWRARNPQAVKAFRLLNAAVENGKVVPAAECQAKGCTKTSGLQAHHHDYREPLSVLWCCGSHHRRGHTAGRIHVKAGVPRHLGRIPLTN